MSKSHHECSNPAGVLPLAQTDIDNIWDHNARDSLVNADRFVDRIERRFALLADNPRLGIARDDLDLACAGFATPAP